MLFKGRTLCVIALLATVFLISFTSCSTKKNTFTRRVYHNLTAHYNAYFNGKEALKEGTQELAKKNIDNYAKVLPVFELGTKQDAQSVYSFLDRALEKGSIVIQRHSIFIKNVEHVRWIDDAYMLIGKSYYFKHEYDLAYQTFNFVINRFKNNDIVYEAVIWKARVLVQQGKLDDAESTLLSIEKKIEKNKATRKAEQMFPLVMADILIKKEQYTQAIDFVNQGLNLNKAKRLRTRLTFILGQLYQRSGNPSKAMELFRKVLGMNPVYEMEFAAKINLAKSYDVTTGGSKDIKKLMTRMLRDEKNKEYLDQIHYALAEIYLKENDMEKAVKHLKLSARTSVNNNFQKSVSYLRLADLYFAEPNYNEAQLYYDSTILFLPKDYPNYQLIDNKKNTLNDLVKNLKVIQLEDSLQMLARLPEAERNKKIDDIIAELIREEERKKQEEADRLNNLANIQQINQGNQTTGSWYFYNPSAMSFGYTEFVKKWGQRKYEDLWRLSNKQITDFEVNIPDDDDDTTNQQNAAEADPKSRATYIAQLPLTSAAVDSSNDRISEALFNVGLIYKESLEDYDKAIESFKKLETRFPGGRHTLPAYYHLYKIYEENNEQSKADYYKHLITTRYPESDYAKILSDPDYFNKLQAEKNRLANYYKSTYLAYVAGDYQRVIRNADSALTSARDKVLIPKFDMLKALAIGKTASPQDFENALKGVISKYPDSDVKPEAQAILDAMAKMKSTANQAAADSVKVRTGGALYKFDPTAFHFYISVFPIRNLNINELKIMYSNHNQKTFSLSNLSVNSLFLDDKNEVINVGRFENMQKAMDYLLSVEGNADIMQKLQPAGFRHFVISAQNYPVFYQNKDVNKYLDFFNKFYLKQ